MRSAARSPTSWTRLRAIAARHAPAVLRVELRRRGHGADRPDREARAADPRLHARHRAPARGDARADRPRARALRPADRRLRARRARACRRFVRAHGVNAFYDSVELRKGCCAIRKAEPLAARWPARARGSPACAARNRSPAPTLPIEEFDAAHGLPKFNPLADWSDDDVWAYLRAHDVPYNALHDRGYPSASAARPARARSSRARTSAPAAGGGKRPSTRNAGCTAPIPIVARMPSRRRRSQP